MDDNEGIIVQFPRLREARHCACAEPDPLFLPLWQALECRTCRRPVLVAPPVEPNGDKTYTLTEVAKLFRTTSTKIKERAMAGDFPYHVNARGHFEFPRASLLVHLSELSKRNNRLG